MCSRPASGFGWFDPAPRKLSHWFCSIDCQGYWWRRHKDSAGVFDLQPEERAALRAAMRPVAEIMEEIGWERRLCDLDEAQVLTLIEVAVGGFQDVMQAAAKSFGRGDPVTEAACVLDFNSRPRFADLVNGLIDAGLEAADRLVPPRTYLGGSRLGHPCERALQFEYAQAPKDDGSGHEGRMLRIFAIGHVLEDLAAAWLRAAGFDLYTRKGNRPDGGQFGFSVADGRIRGHVDGILADGPTLPGLRYPALWECKTMNARSWKETVQQGVVVSKPAYAAQLAVYQAYMEGSVAGISANPALFTAVNKDTAELHHELVPFDGGLAQRMSDRAVRILQATEAGELLPRIAANPDYHECRMCAWSQRCWSLTA